MVVRISEIQRILKERDAIVDLERRIDEFLLTSLPRSGEKAQFQLGPTEEIRVIEATMKMYHNDGFWIVTYKESEKVLVFSYLIDKAKI